MQGEENLEHYRAMVERQGEMVQSKHRRFFCRQCGCHLYAWHENWPDLVHPVASAIDTPLPDPPARVHLMLGSKPNWVPVQADPDDEQYEEYPAKSLSDWHLDHGYSDPDSDA